MKIERANLSESIYREIRTQLMNGVHPPGERLRVGALAEQFGVSITPVRESIFRLVSEGALVMRAATDFSVPVLTAHQLREIQLTRALLEGACAERAASLIDVPTIDRLERIQRDYIDAWKRRAPDVAQRNREFHFVLAAAGDMPIVFGIVERMWVMMGPTIAVFLSTLKPRKLTVEGHEHTPVIRALRARDPVAACEAIQADIRWSDAIVDWVERESGVPGAATAGARAGRKRTNQPKGVTP